MANKVVRRKQ